MIEGALKGIALLALASITINTLKWLFRHLPVLLLAIVVLSAAAWLMR
jgi:hypothetical protein